MANGSVFELTILNKMNTMYNKNNTIQMRIDIVKEVWQLLLTDEGKGYLTRNDNFRNVAKMKVLECMSGPIAENEMQFMAISRLLLTVIANINLGKQV